MIRTIFWLREYGSKSKIAFFESLREKGKPTPLDDAPLFDLEEEWFINAFQRLDNSRPQALLGQGFVPIPISEYLAYFKMFEPVYEIDTTLDILQKIDFDVCTKINQANALKRKTAKTKFNNSEDIIRMGPKN